MSDRDEKFFKVLLVLKNHSDLVSGNLLTLPIEKLLRETGLLWEDIKIILYQLDKVKKADNKQGEITILGVQPNERPQSALAALASPLIVKSLVKVNEKDSIIIILHRRDFDKLYEQLERQQTLTDKTAMPFTASDSKLPKQFQLKKSYRQIYINDYMISIPQEGGDNKIFIDYIIQQPANTPIERTKLPTDIKTGAKSFIKILTALGFSGQIRKLFFYNVGKSKLTYRGDKISANKLKEFGINSDLLLKQLGLKNSENRGKSIADRTI